VLLEHPGIHKPHQLLGERWSKCPRCIGEVDLVLLLVDAVSRPRRGDAFKSSKLLQHGRGSGGWWRANKQDLVDPAAAVSPAKNSYARSARGANGLKRGQIRLQSASNRAGCLKWLTPLAASLPSALLLSSETVSDQPSSCCSPT